MGGSVGSLAVGPLPMGDGGGNNNAPNAPVSTSLAQSPAYVPPQFTFVPLPSRTSLLGQVTPNRITNGGFNYYPYQMQSLVDIWKSNIMNQGRGFDESTGTVIESNGGKS